MPNWTLIARKLLNLLRRGSGVVLGQERGKRLVDGVADHAYALGATLQPRFRSNQRRLRALEGRYRGKACFIIGNGPSLKRMDLAALTDRYAFGLNKIYMMFTESTFRPTFWMVVNVLVAEQARDVIPELPGLKFMGWHCREFAPQQDETVHLVRSCTGPFFSKDPPQFGIWEGATVTYSAMQVAYYLGFEKVFLIGVDHKFRTQERDSKVLVAEGPDEDHFHPDYFAHGTLWQAPDLITSEVAYRLALEAFRSDGREIFDATLEGALEVFPKVSFEQALAETAESRIDR